MQDRACAEVAPETFWSKKDWHQASWRAPLAVPWSMPAERTPRDAVCDWEQISKIRARLYLRLDESCNFSRVTEGRPWTVRPGSVLQKTYSRQPPPPRIRFRDSISNMCECNASARACAWSIPPPPELALLAAMVAARVRPRPGRRCYFRRLVVIPDRVRVPVR